MTAWLSAQTMAAAIATGEAPRPRSHLSESEWQAAFATFGVLDPLAYANVTNTQLSVARHFGGAKVNGHSFYYVPETDELLRADVFKWVEKRRADAVIARRNAEAVEAAVRQGVLFVKPAGGA